jgi:hypothetical protein
MPDTDSAQIRTNPAPRQKPTSMFRLAAPKDKEATDHAPAMLRVSPGREMGMRSAVVAGECPDFTIKWHLATSVFVGGETGSLKFWILPQEGVEQVEISGARIYVQFPGQHYPHEANAVPRTLTGPVLWQTDYSPRPEDTGLDQRFKFVFSYLRNHRAMSYAQQLKIDVLPEGSEPEKVLTRVLARVQTAAGRVAADDERVTAFAAAVQAARDTTTGAVTHLAALDRESFLAVPQRLFPVDDPSRTVMRTDGMEIGERPADVTPVTHLKLTTVDDRKIDVYSGDIPLGDGRDSARLGVVASSGRLVNGMCRAGQWQLTAGDLVIDGEVVDGPFASLAPGPESRTLQVGNSTYAVRVYGCAEFAPILFPALSDGVPKQNVAAMTICNVYKEKGPIGDAIIPFWLPLRELVEGASPEWLLCRRHGAYAITDGSQWLWLQPGVELPAVCGIAQVT